METIVAKLTNEFQVFTVHIKVLVHPGVWRSDNSFLTFPSCESDVGCRSAPQVEQRNVSGSGIIICL